MCWENLIMLRGILFSLIIRVIVFSLTFNGSDPLSAKAEVHAIEKFYFIDFSLLCIHACLNLCMVLLFVLFRTEERAGGWYRVTREILKLPEAPSVSSKGADDDSKDSLPPKAAKEKSPKTRRPQPLFKLVMRRFK